MSARENGWYWVESDAAPPQLCRWVHHLSGLFPAKFETGMQQLMHGNARIVPVATPTELATLRAEVERLREALDKIDDLACEAIDTHPIGLSNPRVQDINKAVTKIITAVRAALEPTP